MSAYEALCRVGERVPLAGRLARREDKAELVRATEFLRPEMSVTPEGVIGAAYLSATLVAVAIVALGFLARLNLLSVVPLSLINGIFVYFALSTYPVSKMNSYRLALSEEADMIFEQFVLVFQARGTIFDAMWMVAESDHPFLSQAFRQMLGDVERGTPPEQCLREFAMSQPSDDLRRYLVAILSAHERGDDLLEALSGQSFEADAALRAKNLELESRLLITAAVTTYLPIIVTLGLALQGLTNDISILLLIPLFGGLSVVLRTRFTRGFSAYFDRPQHKGLATPSQAAIMAEYNSFLNLLLLLSERLRAGDTLEVALTEVRDSAEPAVKPIIDTAVERLYADRPIKEAMEAAADVARGQRVASLVRLTQRMCEVSTLEAGHRLGRIVARLIKRYEVAKERESIIAAQRLKVYLLTLTSAVVLGLLSALAPFMAVASMFRGGGPIQFPALSISDIVPLAITLGVTSLITGHQNSVMVNGAHPRMMGMVAGLAYWLSLVVGLSLVHIV